jgi:methionine synthase II (cobalamin-independent)
MREGYRQRGSDPEELIDRCIELDNAIIQGHPGVTFGLHVCRGNNQSKYYAEGDYEPIEFGASDANGAHAAISKGAFGARRVESGS